MRKFALTLMLSAALVMPMLPAFAEVDDYKGPFSTQVLYTMCSSKSPVLRDKCNMYLQGLMYGLRIQATTRSAGDDKVDMTVCLPDELTTETARVDLIKFINFLTNGTRSGNRDSGDWIAYMSLGNGNICAPKKAASVPTPAPANYSAVIKPWVDMYCHFKQASDGEAPGSNYRCLEAYEGSCHYEGTVRVGKEWRPKVIICNDRKDEPIQLED